VFYKKIVISLETKKLDIIYTYTGYRLSAAVSTEVELKDSEIATNGVKTGWAR